MALKYLRDNLKSLTWVLWLVIVVFVALIFFDWGGVTNRAGNPRTEIAAVVGDENVTFSELEQEYRNLENFYRQTFGEQFSPDLARQLNLPQQALNRAIDRKILLLEARRAGLRATDREISDMILSFPVFQDDNGRFVGTEEYQKRVRRFLRQDVESFETSIRETVMLEKLDALLAQTALVSDEEVERAYRDQAEQAKIRYIELPAAELAEQVTMDDAEAESYFSEHQEDYKIPAQRSVDYLLADTAQLRREIELPEDELRAYYDENQSEFERPEQVRARHILIKITPERPEAQAESELLALKQRIEAGEDFAALAQERSEDEGSASRGGSLGAFGRGSMVPPFEEAAFNAEVGALVGPVKTDFGYHLIEVEEHLSGGTQPFEQVQAVVRARMLGQRVEEIAESKIRDVAEQLANGAFDGEEAFKGLAEEEALKYETTEPFAENDVVPGIGRVPAFTAAAFSLEAGKTSEPIKVSRGWAVLRVKETREPRLPTLDEVREQVAADVKQEKMKVASLARMTEIHEQIVAGKTLDVAAAELGLEVKESTSLTRQTAISDLGRQPLIVEAALALEVGGLGGPFKTPNGAMVFEVLERQKFDPEAFAEAEAETRKEQEAQRVNELRASLIDLRRRDLEPQIARQLQESLSAEGRQLG